MKTVECGQIFLLACRQLRKKHQNDVFGRMYPWPCQASAVVEANPDFKKKLNVSLIECVWSFFKLEFNPVGTKSEGDL